MFALPNIYETECWNVLDCLEKGEWMIFVLPVSGVKKHYCVLKTVALLKHTITGASDRSVRRVHLPSLFMHFIMNLDLENFAAAVMRAENCM